MKKTRCELCGHTTPRTRMNQMIDHTQLIICGSCCKIKGMPLEEFRETLHKMREVLRILEPYKYLINRFRLDINLDKKIIFDFEKRVKKQ